MKTLMNDGDSGQINQCITLKNGTVIKSVLYNDNYHNPVRCYLKYYFNNLQITREMFDSYKSQ